MKNLMKLTHVADDFNRVDSWEPKGKRVFTLCMRRVPARLIDNLNATCQLCREAYENKRMKHPSLFRRIFYL